MYVMVYKKYLMLFEDLSDHSLRDFALVSRQNAGRRLFFAGLE